MQSVNYTSQNYVNDIIRLIDTTTLENRRVLCSARDNGITVNVNAKDKSDMKRYDPLSLHSQAARAAKRILLMPPEQRPPNFERYWSKVLVHDKATVLISADSWQERFSLRSAMPPAAIEEAANRVLLAAYGPCHHVIPTEEQPEYISVAELRGLINGAYPPTLMSRSDKTYEERLLRLTFWNLCRINITPDERVQVMNNVVSLAYKVTDIKEARKQTLLVMVEKLEMESSKIIQKESVRLALIVCVCVSCNSFACDIRHHRSAGLFSFKNYRSYSF